MYMSSKCVTELFIMFSKRLTRERERVGRKMHQTRSSSGEAYTEKVHTYVHVYTLSLNYNTYSKPPYFP